MIEHSLKHVRNLRVFGYGLQCFFVPELSRIRHWFVLFPVKNPVPERRFLPSLLGGAGLKIEIGFKGDLVSNLLASRRIKQRNEK